VFGRTVTHHEEKGDHAMPRSNPRPSALDRLNVFIGRWLTEGETVAAPEAPSVRIFASDVYQWGPGGQFIMHPAYGRIGEQDVGGLEVIGYDPATDQFRTHYFDHTDNDKTLTAHHERSDDGKRWAPSMIVTLRKVE
jgi:hypothetical protein